MNNDLISRNYIVEVYNRVKEACKNCDNYNGVRCRACDIGDELLDLQDIIDNAPTVDIKDQMAGAYNEGYACGSRENARPQGEYEFIEILAQYVPDDICTYPEYKGKPYYSIHYKQNGEEFVGFGTYKIEVLSRYLKDYFMKGGAE